MLKLMEWYDRAVLMISRAAAVIAGLFILATAFIVVYEIVMRGIFNSPTEWVLEISTYLIIGAGFLGMAVTLRHKAHISVDFLTSHLPVKARCALELVTTVLSILLFYVFMTESPDLMLVSYEVNKLSPSILRFPLFIPQSALVIGSFRLELELIRQLLDDVCIVMGIRDGGEGKC